jgi:nicotinate-nucleotide adenylyltransferase
LARIALYGGTFNPIHMAHLVLAETACDVLGLKEVIFIPSKIPPHKQKRVLAPATARERMVRLAVEDNPRFTVSDIELKRRGPSYTIDTVNAFRRRVGARYEIMFLIGGDTVGELHKWHRIDELVKSCLFVPLSRPGVVLPTVDQLARKLGEKEARGILDRMIEMPRLDISASDIRSRVAEGRSIRYLVPDVVATCIAADGLYGRAKSDR